MRGLRELEPAGADAGGVARRPRAARWEDRHRAAFLMLVAGVMCLAVGGYLWSRLPQIEAPPAPPTSAAEINSPQEAFQLYVEMQAGLALPPVETTSEEKTRQQTQWGIGIALALAALAGAGAAVVGLRKPRRR
jgi:hypothetical protein